MNCKYPPYPQYSKRPIDWVDSLPSSWHHIKLRWGASIFAGGTPSKTNEAFWQNGTIPWLNSGSVNQGLIRDASSHITEAGLKSSSARWIKRESLLVALAGQGKTKGMVAQLDFDATCNQSMAAIVPFNTLQPRFLLWWLSNNYQNIRNMAGGDLRDGLNLKLLGDIECPLPSRIEQDQIAEFLDYETAKIDALIEKQQQLIALLKEKRQAVISHAVTKGLNPDATMRNSGVEWLGEIPSHWEVQRLKSLCKIQSGMPKGKPASATTVDMPMLRVANVQEGWLKLDDVHHIPVERAQVERYLLKADDVLMNEGGDRDKLGRGTVWHNEVPNCIHQNHVFAIRPLTIEPEWLATVTRAAYAKFHFYQVAKQSTNLASISSFNIKETPIVLPPIDERKAIIEYIDLMLEKTSATIELASQQNTLLQERRAALISAAVTGKIDVRDWQPPESDKEAEVA